MLYARLCTCKVLFLCLTASTLYSLLLKKLPFFLNKFTDVYGDAVNGRKRGVIGANQHWSRKISCRHVPEEEGVRGGGGDD